MSWIDWREVMAWPVSPHDRVELQRLHQKYRNGEELTAIESRLVERIARVARRNVRGEAAEERLKPKKTVDHLFAELDKLVDK